MSFFPFWFFLPTGSMSARCFTLLLQVLSENAAGLGAVGGVVQGNVVVDILQQNVHPGLPGSRCGGGRQPRRHKT